MPDDELEEDEELLEDDEEEELCLELELMRLDPELSGKRLLEDLLPERYSKILLNGELDLWLLVASRYFLMLISGEEGYLVRLLRMSLFSAEPMPLEVSSMNFLEPKFMDSGF